MYTFLYFTFQDSGPRGLIEPRDFEDMCCINPIIGPPPHQALALHFELIDRNLDKTASLR